jgi:hypothetical protein
LFGEERQRTKVIPLAFGERVVLKSFLHGFQDSARLFAGAIETSQSASRA